MERRVKIFDTTLRDGEQAPGCSMNLEEKIEIARQLELLKVDIIEAGFAISSPGDFDAAYEAVKKAVSPRIHVFIATSPIHMQYKLKMTPEQVLEMTAQSVAYAKKYCSDIEFSAEDAMRSEPEFLARVVKTAIDAGATVVNIPDTVGYTTPDEMFEMIKYIKDNVSGIGGCKFPCGRQGRGEPGRMHDKRPRRAGGKRGA
jgi:2-isopropylmalate synthase